MRKTLTTEEFIERAKKIHGDTYDYSKVNYKNAKTKVTIICPKHGEFEQTPHNHLKGEGCRLCGNEKALNAAKGTQENFLQKMEQLYGNEYDFSKFVYINNETKGIVICHKHGEFNHDPHTLSRGKGCPKCSKEKAYINSRLTNDEFIKRAMEKYNGEHTYEKTDVNKRDEDGKIIVACKKHGDFKINPIRYLHDRGCPMCGRERMSTLQAKTVEDFIIDARKVHGNKYDYTKVEYINEQTPVKIICPIHGEFTQTPNAHLAGRGCQTCAIESIRIKNSSTKEEFVKKATEIHNGKYTYDNFVYTNCHTRGVITCPIHGDFLQTPNAHLLGFGCKKCKNSRAEAEIIKILDTNKVNYDYQCGYRKLKWMGTQTLDFYLPDTNIAIECQGEQHFLPVDFGGHGREWAEKLLEKNIKRDALKRQKCKENGVELIYYADKKYKEYINEKENKAFFNKEELIEYIIEKQS